MSSFTIKQATRQGVKPLVGFYGKSGSGKTFSALTFARGLVGPKGRITLIDSEAGRGHLFADVIPGGYSVIDIEPPFSPDRYGEAFEVAEANSDCVVYDSLSHEWSSEGGVLDMQEAELTRMAGDNFAKRDQCKMAAWIKPKFAHKKFVQRLLRSKVALICCLRGEEKTHISKDGGKTKVITDEFSSPLYDPRFIFELLLNFETVAHDGKGGFVIPRKITHPAIASLLPAADEQLTIKHGELLAQWCASSGTGKPSSSADDKQGIAVELFRLLKPVRGPKSDWSASEIWLVAQGYIEDTETIAKMPTARMAEVLAKVKNHQFEEVAA